MPYRSNLFNAANQSLFSALKRKNQRHQRNLYLLRSQVGFSEGAPSRPVPCQNCVNYHGVAYGTQADRRSRLICAMHPQGWLESPTCPDWEQETSPQCP